MNIHREPSHDAAISDGQALSSFLTPPQAANYLFSAYGSVTTKTLAKFRSSGGGPRWVRFGKRRVLYRAADLDAWGASRISASPQAQTA